MKYTIKITKKSKKYVEVEAKNRDEAIKMAEDMYYAGEVNFDNSEEDFEIVGVDNVNDVDEDNEDIDDDIEDDTKAEYDFIMFDELACAINEAPENTKFDFTFDQPRDWMGEGEIVPTSWNGVRKVNLFDETEGTIVIGYYGGGSTRTYDIGETMDDYYDKDPLTAIKRIIKDYMKIEHNTGDYVCVEITEKNREYIKEAMSKKEL